VTPSREMMTIKIFVAEFYKGYWRNDQRVRVVTLTKEGKKVVSF